VVRELPDADAVFFGAIVEVRDGDGDTHCYRIVGPDETDAESFAISMDSPLARALLKKRIDDEVVVETGAKTMTLSILSIRYEAPQATPHSI